MPCRPYVDFLLQRLPVVQVSFLSDPVPAGADSLMLSELPPGLTTPQ